MDFGRKDYNERIVDSQEEIPVNEPVFLLRGQDKAAFAAVRAWAHQNTLNGGSDEASRHALEHALRMEQWPKKKTATV